MFEQLLSVKNVGPKVAQSIFGWFRDKKHFHRLEKFDAVGLSFVPEKVSSGKFQDTTFVLTGGLETMSREQAKERIRSLGGEVSESVSKRTDYVVVGSDPGSKFETAKNLGVKTLTEEEFSKLLS